MASPPGQKQLVVTPGKGAGPAGGPACLPARLWVGTTPQPAELPANQAARFPQLRAVPAASSPEVKREYERREAPIKHLWPPSNFRAFIFQQENATVRATDLGNTQNSAVRKDPPSARGCKDIQWGKASGLNDLPPSFAFSFGNRNFPDWHPGDSEGRRENSAELY